MPAGLAFTPDCGQTAAGRLYNCPAEDEMRTALQKAIDDADYECGRRMNELDFATAFASPVKVAKKRAGAFNTVRLSSAAQLWIVDNGSLDEHAMPDAELAKELTGQTLAARKARFSARIKTDIPYSALLCTTFTTRRLLEEAYAPPAIPAPVHEHGRLPRERLTLDLRGHLYAMGPPASSIESSGQSCGEVSRTCMPHACIAWLIRSCCLLILLENANAMSETSVL